jgi:hypothetical protein
VNVKVIAAVSEELFDRQPESSNACHRARVKSDVRDWRHPGVAAAQARAGRRFRHRRLDNQWLPADSKPT